MLNALLKSTYQRIESIDSLLQEKQSVDQETKVASSKPILRSQRNRLAKLIDQQQAIIIAEVKYASPSKGRIRNFENPVEIAKDYLCSGANVISVLTEPSYFQGSYDYLEQIRAELPNSILLMKDFVVDQRQIRLAKALGADSVLLLESVLEGELLGQFVELSYELGLEPLVEVNDQVALLRAYESGARLVGVNNRNLSDLTVDINRSIDLAKFMRPEFCHISESGIHSRDQIKMLTSLGYRGFLIGSSLMSSSQPGELLGHLLGGLDAS